MKWRRLEIVDLGQKDYASTYELQKELVNRLKQSAGEPNRLLLVEHPEVYTYGRKSGLFPTELGGVPCVAVERGGEATYHCPGQLVAYPILRLEENDRDVHAYLRRLEEMLITVLARFGLKGDRRTQATGVWIAGAERKIASIGIAISGWVTYHGVALNVNNDLRGFHRISPCGFSAEVMTSLAHEGASPVSLPLAKDYLIQAFASSFAIDWFESDRLSSGKLEKDAQEDRKSCGR